MSSRFWSAARSFSSLAALAAAFLFAAGFSSAGGAAGGSPRAAGSAPVSASSVEASERDEVLREMSREWAPPLTPPLATPLDARDPALALRGRGFWKRAVKIPATIGNPPTICGVDGSASRLACTARSASSLRARSAPLAAIASFLRPAPSAFQRRGLVDEREARRAGKAHRGSVLARHSGRFDAAEHLASIEVGIPHQRRLVPLQALPHVVHRLQPRAIRLCGEARVDSAGRHLQTSQLFEGLRVQRARPFALLDRQALELLEKARLVLAKQ
eukprot:4256541-Prymnesium_polylepis.3